MRNLTKLDNIIREIEYGLETINDKASSEKVSEFPQNNGTLSKSETKLSERIMRVNHMGEVCAQGLYRGQAAFTDDVNMKRQLHIMCSEEREHLKICHGRLDELGAKGSIFNGLWYLSSFTLGALAGLTQKRYGAGFIEETEKQVSHHLDDSIDKLPTSDFRSKEMLGYIKVDEAKHEKTAVEMGSEDIPEVVKESMRILSKVMKKITYYI